MDKVKRARRNVSLYAFPGIEASFNIRTPQQAYMDVLQQIAKRYGGTVTQILSHHRYQEIVHMRKIFVYWMKETYGKDVTYTQLGDWLFATPRLSRRDFKEYPDHASVMHAYKVYKESLESKVPVAMPRKLRHIASSVQEDWKVVKQLLELSCL